MRKSKPAFLSLLIILLTAFPLTGCGKQSLNQSNDSPKNPDECFSNMDFTNYARIDFISHKPGTSILDTAETAKQDTPQKIKYSCACRREDVNYIYQHQDFYEAAYRTFLKISGAADNYTLSDTYFSTDDIVAGRKGHYVQVSLKEPVTVSLSEQEFDGISFLLFDAENGDFWLGSENDTYVIYGDLAGQKENFQIDNDLIDFIDGKFSPPPYDNFMEELVSMLY